MERRRYSVHSVAPFRGSNRLYTLIPGLTPGANMCCASCASSGYSVFKPI